MLGIYLFSLVAGAALGCVHAFVFYRGNMNLVGEQAAGVARPLISGIGAFILRYALLFTACWVLFIKLQLNIYLGMTGFFIAFWVVLLKKMRNKP
jgi:hypothetical protein